jgi:hypothetical protein
VENGIPAVNQNHPFDVHFSEREAHQNGKECGDEALGKNIPIRKSMKKVCLRKIPSSYIPACYYLLN